eukprot:CAMPEP_0178373860 /NCGR_PEP_ID=MMETSP0689_2-20121128/2080_1 /TAXON_ID=160604 /ORGANISM="Amphidinium massartii, Strain CS-259" /LENGTH=703 /DNA_ID=CAMNT_0019993815 /DNA_START=65 /DNA_END=2177 /DNA_ORIENTATION=+
MAHNAQTTTTTTLSALDVDFGKWQQYFVLSLLIGVFLLLFMEKGPPEQVMMGALVIVWNMGIVETHEALGGFGNPGLITVGALFIVATAVDRSRVVGRAARHVLGKNSEQRSALLRLCLASFGFSGFLNNTPLVALFMPIIRDWARARGFAASKFLMPLSFSSIMGGMLTTIGTSTNLLVNGLMDEFGLEPFGFFDPALVSLPVGLVGLAYLLTLGFVLLPANKGGMFRDLRERGDHMLAALELTSEFPLLGARVLDVLDQLHIPQTSLLKILRLPDASQLEANVLGNVQFTRNESPRITTADVLSPSSTRKGAQMRSGHMLGAVTSPLDSVESGALRGDAISLVSATADDFMVSIFPVPMHEVVKEGDRLVLSVGREELMGVISKRMPGLRAPRPGKVEELEMPGGMSEFVELVLAPESQIIGREISQGTQLIGALYEARLIAVRRRGQETIQELKVGTAERNSFVEKADRGTFVAGDTVLVLAQEGKVFPPGDFLLITKVADMDQPPTLYDYVPLVLFFVALSVTATGFISMAKTAVSLSCIIVLGGWVRPYEIREVMDLRLLILIGSALGFAHAISNSGLSHLIAAGVKAVELPPWGALTLLYFMLMTELVTNNAAAALGLPLAVDLAAELGLSSPRPLAMAVMLAASSSFACPIGYQTNLMVLGPGGYTFLDFAKIGLIMDLIFLVGCSALIPVVWPLE